MNNALHTRNIVRTLIRSGEFLLLAKVIKKNFYFLPGGGIEYNEAMCDAARREIHEELGISNDRVVSVQPRGIYEHSWPDNGQPIHELNLICLCRIDDVGVQADVVSREAHLAFEWISINQLSKIDLRPEAFRTLIPAWLEDNKNTSFFATSMQ